ncbi:MAG: hypothetical protein CL675_00755 [Bdellovibrionaceae bacterium]|nr:hypothetical protein [Pseudobdellovibrionaceae bacterium]
MKIKINFSFKVMVQPWVRGPLVQTLCLLRRVNSTEKAYKQGVSGKKLSVVDRLIRTFVADQLNQFGEKLVEQGFDKISSLDLDRRLLKTGFPIG